MSLSEIITVNITSATTGINRASFGTPLILSYHTAFAGRVEEYTTMAEVVAGGFAAASPTYKAANAIFSQTPRPTSIKVGRRLGAPTQQIRLTPTNTTAGLVYTITLYFPNGTSETATYTVQVADTVALIVDGLKTQLDGLTGATYFTTTDQTTRLDVDTDVAGNLIGYRAWNAELNFQDVTADPGTSIADDLDDIEAADPDWYGLIIDSNGEAEIKVAADWIQSRELIAGFNTGDWDVLDSGETTDVASELQSSAYTKSYTIFNRSTDSYAAAAWMGNRFPEDPGGSTWAYKTLTGVPVDTLTASDRSAMRGKNCNYYYNVADRNIAYDGKVASGEYIDVIRLTAWTQARIRERLFMLLVNRPKLAYTDPSVEIVKNEIYAVLLEGIANGGYAANPDPIVTAPKVADVSDANKAGRILPDVEFSATLAGAIHTITVSGVISL